MSQAPPPVPAAASAARTAFAAKVVQSGLLTAEQIEAVAGDGGRAATPEGLARALVAAGLLTAFQARLLLKGKGTKFLVAGKYKVLDQLGAGGMGAVYLCEHMSLQAPVAIKLLTRDTTKQPGVVERFRQEARAAAGVSHPNVVRTFDMDRDGDHHFLVMEYVDGCDLQRLVDRNGPLEAGAAAWVGVQVAHGLQGIADAGWVHRDIKPANVLLDRAGVVKISYLGLARAFVGPNGYFTEMFNKIVLWGRPTTWPPSRRPTAAGWTSGPTCTPWAAPCTS